ncbi:alpha-tectorin-like, partial [Stegastes partitus]|uniref:Alpha-tectorin-like n=1 Tax=Stegastes partitus TaxID=144197 RepID=A0A9Y4TXP3_9TELE
CIPYLTCTITGPTVIDTGGTMKTVEDRCAYSLLHFVHNKSVDVLAKFQERRRKDVSFLEYVTLNITDNGIHYIRLEQGGRVWVNDALVDLNSTPQEFHNVMLSKDEYGVTAKLSIDNKNTTVFFDGLTAQLYFEENVSPKGLDGLCGSRPVDDNRINEAGNSSCETAYTEPDDDTFNSTVAAMSCQLLDQEAFAACSEHISPQPYKDACHHTLTKYRAVDRLSCQFLEAFAQVCNHRGIPLQDWRTNASCSPPEIFCQDRTCSAHEFCGEKTPGGDTRCFCRAIFASKYNDSFGEPTSCSQDSGQVSVSLVGCLLENKGIDYSALHLNNDTCRGQMDEVTHMVTFSYNSSNTCGAYVVTNDHQTTFTNTIMTQAAGDIITRHDQVNINFSCIHTQPKMQFASFRIRDSSVFQNITSGAFNYNLTMKAYSDPAHTQALLERSEHFLSHKTAVWGLSRVGQSGPLLEPGQGGELSSEHW